MMTINKIRFLIGNLLGKNITVVFYGSRNKKEKYTGMVYKLYRNIFIIKLPSGNIKSFSYIDVLTKTVKIYN